MTLPAATPAENSGSEVAIIDDLTKGGAFIILVVGAFLRKPKTLFPTPFSGNPPHEAIQFESESGIILALNAPFVWVARSQ